MCRVGYRVDGRTPHMLFFSIVSWRRLKALTRGGWGGGEGVRATLDTPGRKLQN